MAGAYEVLEWDDKDPAEIINEAIDFASALDTGDSLTNIAFDFEAGQDAGVIKTNPRIDGTLARVTLSGGTDGQAMRLLCSANTQGGELLKQVVKMKVKAKV